MCRSRINETEFTVSWWLFFLQSQFCERDPDFSLWPNENSRLRLFSQSLNFEFKTEGFLAKIFQIKKETEKNLSRLWFAWHLEYQIVKTETFIKPQFFLFSRLRLFLIRQKLWKLWIFRSLVDLCWHFCCTFENCFIMAYIPRFLHYKTCLAHIALIWIKIVLLSVLS